MNLVLAPIYNINLEDWNLNCINKIAKTYSEVSKTIVLWLQYLQSEESEKLQ